MPQLSVLLYSAAVRAWQLVLCVIVASSGCQLDFNKNLLLWTPAQRKRASMLYFANVFFIFIFYGRLILWPWLTEVRESFTRGGP